MKSGGFKSRKIPKTLSGIETYSTTKSLFNLLAAKYLKPYQGLKRMPFIFANNLSALLSRKIPKTLSGIETREA